MKLSRKAIQRMVDSGQVNIGGRRTGSGGGGGGGVSATWVEENYISKEFFNTLFTIHGHDADDTAVPPTDVIIEPNDTETVLDSIEAMVGLWTEKYLSALGLSSGGGGGGDVLAEPLVSINGIGTPTAANRTLVWNGTQWTFQPYGQGGGSVTSIRITVPTGFNVSPSTAITTAGTFAITFASGYSLPSTADQANWDTAYNNNHTHSNKTVLDGISSTKVSNWDSAYSWVNTNGASTVEKTAWGKKYWLAGAPATINGDMTSVGDISFSASGKNIGGVAYFDTTNSRLGIGAAPGAYKLDVSGTVHLSDNLYINSTKKIVCMVNNTSKTLLDFDGTQVTLGYGFNGSNATNIYGQNINMYYGTSLKVQVTTDGLKIGGATLSWDSNANALKIDTGFYSESFISALGAGSGGGSGSGITMSDVWQAMAYTAPSSSSQQIHVSHLAQALTTYATKTWVNDNFVTLVGAQSITGRKTFVSGLTTNGTTIINLGAKFYSICVECASDGTPDVNRSGEINRYNGKDLNLQYDTGTGNVTMCRNNLYFYHNSGMSYISSRNNNLQVYVGNGNPYIDKSWIVTSDERMKDIFGYVEASVKQIANAPIFNYRIKGDETEDLFLGTSAQCWQKIFPSAVREKPDGFFGFDYASAALAAAVMTARHVMTHEERIKALEKENKELRKQIETLKAS